MTLDPAGLEAAAKALERSSGNSEACDTGMGDCGGTHTDCWHRSRAADTIRAYLAATVPAPTTENPEAVTLAFWECGHVEVDRGVEHPCDRDVCSATYASYAPVAAGRAAATPDPPEWACARCGAVSDRQSCRECGAECRPAASPDERLREALAEIVRQVEKYPALSPTGIMVRDDIAGMVEGAARAALAAAAREKPDAGPDGEDLP